MIEKDFDLFKQKYKENCRTKSANSAILELYSYLLEKETIDSDVWTVGGGNDDVIRILEIYFSDNDWFELELDLQNWTTNQLEIFTECLVDGIGNDDEDDASSTITRRFYLLKKLLIIGEERDRYRNDIFLAFIDNIEFLNKCKSIPLKDITEIANYFNYFETIKTEDIKDNLVLQTLKKAIEKASS